MYNSKRYMHHCVYSSSIHNSQDTETVKCLTNQLIKMWCVCVCMCDMYVYIYIYIYIYAHTHTHNGVLLSHKKNEIVPSVAIWIDLEIIILSEVS